ncbi:solA [Symbiodinium natans]|uniref:SolA protein n=1 Tax=Symbiodinium natans TaxID=878477 RepID=A0A812V630_9DINO|nr:solA [Symbiodinium natans]
MAMAMPRLMLAGGTGLLCTLQHRRWSHCEHSPPRVVILGAGVMGLSTAWSLSRSGEQVVVCDGGHAEKGSWGESRIARVSYADDVLVKLARRSYELYGELSKVSAEPLMYKTGCLDVGFKRESLDKLAETYDRLAQPYQRLTHSEVRQRWPMLQLSSQYVEASVYCPLGDAVCAGVVVESLKDQVQTHAGATAMVDEPVVCIDRQKKTVTTADGSVIPYSKLVVATGIWTNCTLQKMSLPLLPLVASIEQQTYYSIPEGKEELYSFSHLPVIVEHNPSPEPQMKRRGGYMIPHLSNGVDGVKFGMHRQGPLLDNEDFPMAPGSAAASAKYFSCSATRGRDVWCSRWPEGEDAHLRTETDAFCKRILPGLDSSAPPALTMRCPYDQQLYADEDFVVGVHPEDCDIIIVGGFAGEGFKFGPAIGEMAACLVTGSPFTVPEAYQRFRLDRKTLI